MKRTVLARAASLIVLGASLAFASPALGQATDRTVAAESLFQEGKQLVEAGNFVGAADKFAASYQLDRAWGPLFNLAHCHEQMGKTASAWAEFREAAMVAKVTAQQERQDSANARADLLEPKLVRFNIQPAAIVPGLVITRNSVDVPQALWGASLPVDPGDYAFTASAPGKVTVSIPSQRAERAGEVVSIRIPALQDIPRPFLQQHRASLLTASGAVVLAGVGFGLGASAAALHSTVGEKCAGTGGGSCPVRDDLAARVHVTNGFFVAAGVVGLASGLIFLVAERRNPAAATTARITGSPAGVMIRF
jgi:hypothetical protein